MATLHINFEQLKNQVLKAAEQQQRPTSVSLPRSHFEIVIWKYKSLHVCPKK